MDAACPRTMYKVTEFICVVFIGMPILLQIESAKVVGVTQVDKYMSCIKCPAKIYPDGEDPDIATCFKCGTTQCITAGNDDMVAHVIVDVGDGIMLSLRVFGKVLQEIAETPIEAVTAQRLLKAKPFTMCHKDGIIQSVSRK